MDTIHSSGLTHSEAQQVLPWYVNKRLGTDQAQRVEAHMAGCPICRGEVDELAALFTAHDSGGADRPVNEARLDAVFARIDRYEAERRRQADRRGRPRWDLLGIGLLGWLIARPALVAGTFAAVALTVVAVPMLRSPGEVPYQVLSSGEPAAEALRVRLEFQTAPDRGAIERVVSEGIAGRVSQAAYRVEQRSATEYLVIFAHKPPVTTVSDIVDSWSRAPNVRAAAIDDKAASQ